MEVNNELKDKAISLGLCQQWTSEWSDDETKDTLCEKYMRGIDFCIEHDYPSSKYLKDNFDGVMQNHGMFVDDIVNRDNLRVMTINGLSIGSLNYDKFNIGRIYLRHNSRVNIDVKDNAKILVSMYDNSVLNVTCSGESNVYVQRHGGKINYDKNNKNILIHECI